MKLSKRLLIAVMALVLAFSSFAFPISTHAEAANPLTTGTYRYSPHDSPGKDLPDTYVYSDDHFLESSYQRNEHLATMSMIMAAASISSEEEDYATKSKNIIDLLSKLGFSDVEVNDEYQKRPGEQTMGAAVAQKQIEVNGVSYTLLALVPRSAGYESEWVGNFTVGSTGVHEGFAAARDQVLSFAKDYIARHSVSGNVKVWTMGYSRGAATANVTGGYLDENQNALGVTVLPENIYTYTFGTPACVPTDMAAGELYNNIFNYFAEYDPVAMMPFAQWGFSRYGISTLFPVNDAAEKAEMLSLLAPLNNTIYQKYIDPTSGADPDHFSPKMFQTVDGSLKLVNDTSGTSPAAATQKEFFEDRIAFVSANLVTDRATYASIYQKALQTLMYINFGLTDGKTDAFFDAVTNNDYIKPAVGLIYLYYIAGRYESATASAKELLDIWNAYETRLQDNAEFESIKQRDDYKTIKQQLEAAAAVNGLISSTDFVNTVKSIAASLLKDDVFTAALDRISAEQGLRDRLLDDTVISSLIDFLAYFLMGSDSEEFAIFDLENNQLKMAATLLGNTGSYMRVHNNEIILSWVRAADSYYPLKDASITPSSAAYDKKTAASGLDIVLTPELHSLSAIKNGSAALILNTDYTVNGNVYTIKQSYLSAQAAGTAALTFDMSAGNDPTAAITITDSSSESSDSARPSESTSLGSSANLNRSSGSTSKLINATASSITKAYDKLTATEGLSLILTPGSYTLLNIKNGQAILIKDTDYTVNGNTYTIMQSYLDAQPAGVLILTLDMSGGKDPTVEIEIKDSVSHSYSISEGANTEWTRGSGKDITFTCSAELEKYQSAQIDGITLDADDLFVEKGSTVVTIKTAYLETLSAGEHVLKLIYTDGFAETVFTVNEASAVLAKTDTGSSSLSWIGIGFAGLAVFGIAVSIVIMSIKRRQE